MRLSIALLAVVLALAAAATAAAATAPSASTGPVSSVGPTTATVTGTVDPHATATSWYVEYGTTTSYGSKTTAASAGGGTGSVPVSANLTGLKAGTTYHYRVVATSSAGTGKGADGILTTSSAPAAVTGSATSITASSATLNGSVNPNGRATSWYFQYGTSTSYGSRTAAHAAGAGSASVAAAAPIAGLTAGRTYHFRLVATSDAGTAKGADKAFVAAAVPVATTRPATVRGDTSARLNGSAVRNGSATTAYFQYGVSASYGSRTAARSLGSGAGAASVGIAVSGLSAATTYHVRLVASNAYGTSYGADQTFTTTGAPRPSTSAASPVGGIAATLNGAVNPNGHATTWYAEWGTSTAYGGRTAAKSIGGGQSTVAVSTSLSGLQAGTLYHFRIVATNASGTRASGDSTFTTLGPAVTLAAASTSVRANGAVRLAGTVVTQAAGQSVSIYAQRYGEPDFVLVASVLTGSGGAWGYDAHPTIATTYKATTAGGASSLLRIRVAPLLTLTARSGRFTVRVRASRSFAGRKAFLQRRVVGGRWRTVGTRRLVRGSTTTFTPKLKRGRWTLRVKVGASPGYLAGTSRVLVFRKR